MDGVLERLYTPEGASLATNWLWENRTQLFVQSNLKVAAPVAMYAAIHAVTRFGSAIEGFSVSEGWATTAEDAEFIGLLTEVAEANGHQFDESTQGGLGGKLLAQALAALARKLLEQLLEQLG